MHKILLQKTNCYSRIYISKQTHGSVLTDIFDYVLYYNKHTSKIEYMYCQIV